MRRGPASPAPIMPPMVPYGGPPNSAAVSIGSKANCWFFESISDITSASGAPASTVMINSFGSYDVTLFKADMSSTALVAIGGPISRLEPWPMISSGCSSAIAARTTASTSAASRTFRVSTANRLAVPSPSHSPSKGMDDGHKGGTGGRLRRSSPIDQALGVRRSHKLVLLHARFDRDRIVYMNNSSSIELYLAETAPYRGRGRTNEEHPPWNDIQAASEPSTTRSAAADWWSRNGRRRSGRPTRSPAFWRASCLRRRASPASSCS